MTRHIDAQQDTDHQEPIGNLSETANDEAVADDQLDDVAGGFDPQPDPPADLLKLITLNQASKLFRP